MSRQPKAKSALKTARWRAMPVKVYSARDQQVAIEALAENVFRLVTIVQGLASEKPVELIEGKNIAIQRAEVQGVKKFKVSAEIPSATEDSTEGRVAINAGAVAIPPYSAMEILSVNADASVNVGRPTEDDLPAGRVLFSRLGINVGETGRGYSAFAFPVEIECDGSPGEGDELGTQADDFPLAEGSGFIYQGDTEDGRGTVRPTGGGGSSEGTVILIAKTTGAGSGDRTYAVDIYSGYDESFALPVAKRLLIGETMVLPSLDDSEDDDRLPTGTELSVRQVSFTVDEEEVDYWVPTERVGMP